MPYMYKYLEYQTMFDELTELCEQYGINVSSDALTGCLEHLDRMLCANEMVNLTSITEPHDALILHVFDSLMLLPLLDDAPHGRFLDLGTGGGFPGIPLTLASGRHAILLDSVGKKINLVQEFIRELDLNSVTAVHDRVESYAKMHRSSCSAVVARAVAPLPVLIEYASPLLTRNGLLVVTKGIPSDNEFDSGERAATLCGFSSATVIHTELPYDMGSRALIVYKKVNKPRVSLPRAVGVAKKKPLA